MKKNYSSLKPMVSSEYYEPDVKIGFSAISEQNYVRRLKKVACQRMLLIRRLIDLSYTYSANKDLFYRKFCETINISELQRLNIVDQEVVAYDNPGYFNCRADIDNLSFNDRYLWNLILEGYTPRELSIVYNHSNPHSIYVKRSRFMNRLGRKE